MSIETKIDDLIAALDRNTAAHAGKSTAPATTKAAKAAKPAKSEEEVVAAAVAKNAAAEETADAEVPLEMCSKKVETLLKANKRAETIALLASFNGAKSASGIPADSRQTFLDQADEILLSV